MSDKTGREWFVCFFRVLRTLHWDIEDSTQQLQLSFTDASDYEPATWHWNFAGLATSPDTNPVFTFPAPGVYTVCLTVCNAYTCDTLCREVVVSGVSGVEPEPSLTAMAAGIQVFPNPADDKLWVLLPNSTPNGTLFLTNSLGQKMAKYPVWAGKTEINTTALPNGLYFFSGEGPAGGRFAPKPFLVQH